MPKREGKRCDECGKWETDGAVLDLSQIRLRRTLCRGCYEIIKRSDAARAMTAERNKSDADRFRDVEAIRAQQAIEAEKRRIRQTGEFFS